MYECAYVCNCTYDLYVKTHQFQQERYREINAIIYGLVILTGQGHLNIEDMKKEEEHIM